MTKEAYIIGVDGGGTRCRAQLEDMHGNILGQAESGSANIMTNAEQALRSIISASEEVVYRAGRPISLEQVYLGAGLAGANIPSAVKQFHSLPNPFKAVHVMSDLHSACLGAHNGSPGALVICGTGSAGTAYQNGKFFDRGGYGIAVGDNASGAWLGLEAIKYTLLAFDGVKEKSVLFSSVCAHFNLKTAAELTAQVKGFKGGDYGVLAPMVVEAFNKDCPVAKALMTKGASYLSTIASSLSDNYRLPLSLVGGLNGIYTPLLTQQVQSLLVTPKSSPQTGVIDYMKQKLAEN